MQQQQKKMERKSDNNRSFDLATINQCPINLSNFFLAHQNFKINVYESKWTILQRINVLIKSRLICYANVLHRNRTHNVQRIWSKKIKKKLVLIEAIKMLFFSQCILYTFCITSCYIPCLIIIISNNHVCRLSVEVCNGVE